MFAVCAILFLCLMSLSHSAPEACTDLVKPFDELDPHHYEGRWVLTADSLRTSGYTTDTELFDSVTLDFYNSSFIKAGRSGEDCKYFSHNVTIKGSHYNFTVQETLNFSGTVFRTSCSDCIIMSFNLDTPGVKSEELCLFSKKRKVEESVLREFVTLVECLSMPAPVVMDPTMELCPTRLSSHSSVWGDNRKSKG